MGWDELPRRDDDVDLVVVPPQVEPLRKIRVHVICCANDDGSELGAEANVVAGWMPRTLEAANTIFAAGGAGMEFTFDPADIETRNDTLLNQDFAVPAMTNMSTPKTQPPYADPIRDLGGDNDAHRQFICGAYGGRCVFLLCRGTQFHWDDATQAWKIGGRTGAYSSLRAEFVTFPGAWGAIAGTAAAHELGHYFDLDHTFESEPKTIEAACKLIADYVDVEKNSKADGLLVFDGDRAGGVWDTPPIPGQRSLPRRRGPGQMTPIAWQASSPS